MPPKSPRKNERWERKGTGQQVIVCGMDRGHVVWCDVKCPWVGGERRTHLDAFLDEFIFVSKGGVG